MRTAFQNGSICPSKIAELEALASHPPSSRSGPKRPDQDRPPSPESMWLRLLARRFIWRARNEDAEYSLMSEMMNDVFRWDVINWSRHIDIWEDAIRELRLRPAQAGEGRRPVGLEIGADWGGGLALWMASRGLDVISSHHNPVGWNDWDTSYADEARRVHELYGVAERVRHAQLDVLHMPSDSSYDVIMLKSVLGGLGPLPRQKKAIAQIHAALREGGLFLFAENISATPIHSVLRRIKRGQTWYYQSLSEMDHLLSVFGKVAYRTTGLLGAFGMSERQRRMLGRLDTYISRMVPNSWHYICIGAAVKTRSPGS
jgi:SAM-dependent methyltransferase